MSSAVGSLAWDADDLDGELCLGAGVGATPRPRNKRKHYKGPAVTIYRDLIIVKSNSYTQAKLNQLYI